LAAERIRRRHTTVLCWHRRNGRTKTGRILVFIPRHHPFAGKAPKAVHIVTVRSQGEPPKRHLAGFKAILQRRVPGYSGLVPAGVRKPPSWRTFGGNSSTSTPRRNRLMRGGHGNGSPRCTRAGVGSRRTRELRAEGPRRKSEKLSPSPKWLTRPVASLRQGEMAKAIRYALRVGMH